MKHVVGFSGGAASSLVAKMVYDLHGDDAVFLFCDTRTEPEDNYRFREDVSRFIGHPITTVADGRDIWQLFKDEGFLGNQRLSPCSRLLKARIGDEWMRDNGPCIYYVGFTPDEYRRAQRVAARRAQDGVETRFPLIENNISKNECLSRIQNCWNLRLPDMYSWAEHANCVPCVKGGLAYWGLIYIHHPDAWLRAVRAEKEHGEQILKKSRYGFLDEELPHCLEAANNYLKKRQMKEGQASLFDAYPCECMV